MENKCAKTSYHHGDLRQTLLEHATEMIEESGIEGLSLRKLATRVGVSRTAPYHHFKDKNDLLCAIAEKGYQERLVLAQSSFDDDLASLHKIFRDYVHGYVRFAHENPELYELMFGRAIWKQQNSTQELLDAAIPCFQHQLEMTTLWQKKGLLTDKQSALRLSQVVWGTLHGIAKLLIDGIYTHASQVEEMCDCAVDLFTQSDGTDG
ncbi:MAG: TetR/AcrR family transcriptional regulator [Gammaproteobacteria bacterium]|nr:MAG: TetR/AcrR family transcriptional regulator [Gammaproteobacteria bacterium]